MSKLHGSSSDAPVRGRNTPAFRTCLESMPRASGDPALAELSLDELLKTEIGMQFGRIIHTKKPHYDMAMRVVYHKTIDFVIDYAKNISAGGMFLEGRKDLPVGTTIAFWLQPPGVDEQFELMGQVVWRSPFGGCGVRFLDTPISIRERLGEIARNLTLDEGIPIEQPVVEEFAIV